VSEEENTWKVRREGNKVIIEAILYNEPQISKSSQKRNKLFSSRGFKYFPELGIGINLNIIVAKKR